MTEAGDGRAVDAEAALTQFAVLDALLAGAYDSGALLADVLGWGDFGLGCCDHLGGEVVVLDGEAFECSADGAVARMREDEVLPFANVCRLGDTRPVPVGALGLAGLEARIEEALVSRNLFHAVRVDGVLRSVRVRATPRQLPPYRPLAEVAGQQVETVLRDVEGTLVGFWAPAIYQGVTVAGLHLHFLAEDRSSGGHVLDLETASGRLRLRAFARLDLRLPTDPLFLATELTHDEDHRIVAVEGGGAG